ncbi:hypothetical protein EPUS_01025 [Endocarpon pusillum Z07020]|uniref:Uncharacterized protein n=1 Tax=Endocarpon pusillum (strain Z07020 / HMAS-L-300199) TaxID=1263415 RepID=U1HJH0_ENDPU|nr:uncharacterized protein EPUS_01025 [Endocarpon pusillum Z07020]ERF69069.1 hypothetical protein EPUS_01025 [Endocarpon pusillum Z07020]
MFGCFRGPTVRIEKHTNSCGPPTRSYQFIRSSSTKTQCPSSTAPTPASVRVCRPPPEVQPVEDNFHPPEGDGDYPQQFRRHNVTGPFHPLPIIHQHTPPIHPHPPPSQQNDPPQPGGNEPIIIDDHHQPAVAGVAKHDHRGRRVLRVHRSHPHRRSLSRNTSRARSGSGKYYSSYYDGSGGSRLSRDWDGSDSWGGTVKSGYWSDGGDSWDGNHETIRVPRIGNGGRDGRRGYYLK